MVKPHMFIIDTKGNIAGHFSENTKENKDKTYSIVKNLLNKIKAQEGEQWILRLYGQAEVLIHGVSY